MTFELIMSFVVSIVDVVESQFCRTISVAELQPSDVRPQHVLWGTLQYLMHMLDRRDHTFESVHAFLFDRTRAVRQELGMQCIANSQAITMFEEIVSSCFLPCLFKPSNLFFVLSFLFPEVVVTLLLWRC